MHYRLKSRPIYEYRCCKQCPLGKNCMIFRAYNAKIDISKGILVKCPAIQNREQLIPIKIEIA